ncbi:integrase [uncultured Pseudomonas sp.]|uniref:integrase n=1 Tax=uncultured Pseudomonas sp. TaxID=114707 RepID=UPI0026292933|nr:integrase [uncultured Pseudomonas sp.]
MSYASTLYAQADKSISMQPDSPNVSVGFRRPDDDFVLCRDRNGKSTAIYGAYDWNFNPYRLSAKNISVIRFGAIFEESEGDQDDLISEIKYLLFCLIYYVGKGRVGKFSASTVVRYFYLLSDAARFCYEQKNKPLVGVLSLEQLLTTPAYLAAYVMKAGHRSGFSKEFPALLNNLIAVGQDCLGYRVVSSAEMDFGVRERDKQHPVIPTRIYLEIINRAADLLDPLYRSVDRFELFLREFTDWLYGREYKQQTKVGGDRKHRRLTFSQAIKKYDLEGVLVGDFSCSNRKQLACSLLSMQFLLKSVIHLYTGMRDQEIMRLQRECLAEDVIVHELRDSEGIVRDRERMVSIISTTTKFEGYRKEESWLATDEVVKAVRVAQAISGALSGLYKGDEEHGNLLFLNPSVLYLREGERGVGNLVRANVKSSWIDSIVIDDSDFMELVHSDQARDYFRESKFQVGRPWPLTSHQFRRSLAFYASNSGFVSLPSLKVQFKHMTLQMSRYYRNGFDKLKTIFGYYDSNKDEFVLPQSHIALEFQMAMPMAVANQIIADVLGKDTPLFGGTGSYMEKQKKRLKDGDVHIEEFRVETLSKVRAGEIFYRPTLLGGCTKVGRCDFFLLGDFTACLACDGAVIKSDKIDWAIDEAEAELVTYEKESGEYQVVERELGRLVSFKARLIDVVRIES